MSKTSVCVTRIAAVALLMAGSGYLAPVRAQSLGEIARKAKEAREKAAADRAKADAEASPKAPATTVKGDDKPKDEGKAGKTPPKKVFTNADLEPTPPPPPPPPVVEPGAPPGVTASTTDPRTEPYWRERRRVIDAGIHDDQMADKAALDKFLLMEKTGIMRRDPAAYVAAMADMKRTSEAVSYDVFHLVPDFYAEGERAGVPKEWLRPSDR